MDQKEEQQELINLWLISLDKARKSFILPRPYFVSVKDFYAQKFKYDAKIVHECIFFEQLKPRLQREINA